MKKRIFLAYLILLLMVIVAFGLVLCLKELEVEGIETESYYYICQEDVPLCQEERANNCLSPKLVCLKCCDEWGLN